jgi:hypothetical protein
VLRAATDAPTQFSYNTENSNGYVPAVAIVAFVFGAIVIVVMLVIIVNLQKLL